MAIIQEVGLNIVPDSATSSDALESVANKLRPFGIEAHTESIQILHRRLFYCASASCRDGSVTASASAASHEEAHLKAIVEAYERYVSMHRKVDVTCKAMSFESTTNWLNPNIYAPLTKDQRKVARLRQFDESVRIAWTEGYRYDGALVYVPSDLVYYDQHNSRIYWGHSSGVAAHTDVASAKCNAVTELIERDAIMRSWFERICPNRIDKHTYPSEIREHVGLWRQFGYDMHVLQLPSKYGMVFLVIITREKKSPYFVAGAAATITGDWLGAMTKAMYEAEAQLHYALRNEQCCADECSMMPFEVKTPEQHGAFWRNASLYYKHLLDFLPRGRISETLYRPAVNLTELYAELELTTVRMDDYGPLPVIRAFSPKLIPINFGYKQAHYTHKEVKVKPGFERTLAEMPIYFA